MQTFRDPHNGLEYFYMYVEKIGQIIVWKGDRQEYILTVHRQGTLISLSCDCDGGRWRGYCHHEKKCAKRFNYHRIVKPRAWLNKVMEEYAIEWLYVKKHGFTFSSG